MLLFLDYRRIKLAIGEQLRKQSIHPSVESNHRHAVGSSPRGCRTGSTRLLLLPLTAHPIRRVQTEDHNRFAQAEAGEATAAADVTFATGHVHRRRQTSSSPSSRRSSQSSCD